MRTGCPKCRRRQEVSWQIQIWICQMILLGLAGLFVVVCSNKLVSDDNECFEQQEEAYSNWYWNQLD